MDGSLFANVPATPPPPGEKSDFTAPPPNAIALRVLATLSLAVALVAVVIRLYVKRSIKKQRLTWDDGTCLLALCAAIIHAGIFIKSLECGLGKHTWNIRAVSLTHHRLRVREYAQCKFYIQLIFSVPNSRAHNHRNQHAPCSNLDTRALPPAFRSL